MSITSNLFFLFTLLGLCIYYIVPKRVQWVVLLVLSYAYYMIISVPAVGFLIYSTMVTFCFALWISRIREREAETKERGKKLKRIVTVGILLDLGMLFVLKYTNFLITNINVISGTKISLLNFILPLGISYYTFQSLGYLLDVYWGREEVEHNFFRYALFVSFFPQLVQGPIGRHGKLAPQFEKEHPLELSNLKYGFQRLLWGLFKKMLVSEWAGIYREAILSNMDTYSGIAGWGILLYTIELYGDFAGGIDMVVGIAAMFGIRLDENFRQPLFSTSIADFWRRWHITLGAWMKDYVFYPLTLSGFMRKVQKLSKKLFGRKKGRAVPPAISNLVIFLLVGLWHGASWNYIGWGFYNGAIIAFSGLMTNHYTNWKRKLHINDQGKGYKCFMILRTFILFNVGQFCECVSSAGEGLKLVKYTLTSFHPSQFLLISSGKLGTEYTPYALATLFVGCLIWFVVSFLKEREMNVIQSLAKLPLPVEFAVWFLLMISIPLFSPMSVARGFIYAQF